MPKRYISPPPICTPRDDLPLPPGTLACRWDYIPDCNARYCIASTGLTVLSSRTGVWQPIPIEVDRDNYRVTNLSIQGRTRARRIHQIVFTLFSPEPRPSPRHTVCHKNDDLSKNGVDDLYWGTPRENNLDALRNGRIPAALPVPTVIAIYEAAGTHSELAQRFEASIGQVRDIRNRRTYYDFTRNHQAGEIQHPSRPIHGRLSDDQVRDLRHEIAAGIPVGQIARRYKVSPSTITAAASGQTYCKVGGPLRQIRPHYTLIRHLPTPVTLSLVEHSIPYDPDHTIPQRAAL